jgi:glycosyltransferase involved in cell wall biosynthesis
MDQPPPDPDDGAMRAVVAAHLDAAFYLRRNADVRAAGVDAAGHYCDMGWREGRDPAGWFDTDYYLRANPDIRAAAVNPFWHYLVRGRAEGRPARPPGDAWRAELAAWPPAEAPAPPIEPPELDAAELRARVLAAVAGASGLVVALSHDRYTEVPGGTQLLIADEQRKFNGDLAVYLHLAPLRPRLGLAPPAPQALSVLLDGDRLGVARDTALTAALAGLPERPPRLLVVHNLHGHRPEHVAALAAALRPRAAIYWAHDYGAACANPRLLRNGLAFCHAPPPDSMACRVCAHGEGRADHRARVRALFHAVPFHVAAPSPAALALWQRATLLPAASLRVHAHAELAPAAPAPAPAPGAAVARSGPVRVAFVGPADYFKGWPVFVALAAAARDQGAYRCFQFAAADALQPPEHGCGVATVTSSAAPFAMVAALAAHRIDLVLALSPWPETFGYVAHEALAAGADVVTTRAAGHVAALVRQWSRGLVLADAAAVLDCFASLAAARHALARRANPPPPLTLRHTGSTATLALDEAAAATTTLDPDLHLLAAGERLDGARAGAVWRFALPRAGVVRLRSRRLHPAWADAACADARRLGVAVTALALDGRPVPPGDARRAAGWHPPERDWQWTDGDAVIAVGAARLLQVAVAPQARYWRAPLLAR